MKKTRAEAATKDKGKVKLAAMTKSLADKLPKKKGK